MSTRAQKEKEKGNVAFKAADYPAAIGHYTAAIMADPKDPTYPLNRAAAYLKLGKYEDAERDCNTVLGLNARNVKAHFRRGQAAIGLGKFIEAQRAFTEALRLEPDNQGTKEELRKVAELIEAEKRKKSHHRSVNPTFDSSLHSHLAPKRRRVPITIVEPPSSSAHTPDPVIQWPQAGTSASEGPSEAPPSPADGDQEEVSPLRSSPIASATPKASFKEAKQAREQVRTSRVGGGIFRASGQNTIFPSRNEGASNLGSPLTPATSQGGVPIIVGERGERLPVGEQSSMVPTSGPEPKPQSLHNLSVKLTERNDVPTKPPATLFDLNRAWRLMATGTERWQLLQMIPPSSVPSFFKTSLEPALLFSILETFLAILSSNPTLDDIVKIGEYMENLAKVPRFSTLILFLSTREKGVAKEVWRKLDITQMPQAWSAIGPLSS